MKVTNLQKDLFDRLSGEFLIAEWTAEARNGQGESVWEAPLHKHFHCDEAWYVVEGTLGFLVDGQTVIAEQGSFVWVDKGQEHTYWNASELPTRYLLFMTPKTKALIDAIHESNDRTLPRMAEIYHEYDGELIY